MKENHLITTAERAHHEALNATRRAIRAGDLARAERWMKLSERYSRAIADTYRSHDERVAERVVQQENVRAYNAWRAAQKKKEAPPPGADA